MKNLVLFAFLLLFYSCSTPVATTEEETKALALAFQPRTGKIYPMYYEFSVQNDSTGDRTDFIARFSAEVTESKPEKVMVVTHYDSIRMKAHINGADIQLDAADLPEEESEATGLAAPVFAYLGKSFETTFDTRHNKLNEKQIRQKNDSSVIAAENRVQFVGRYPQKKLAKGDTWSSQDPIRIGSNEIKSMKYTVKEISSTEAIVDLYGEINNNSEKFGREFQITGELKGTVYVDLHTGWQNRTELDIRFILEMGNKSTPMQQKISYRLIK